MNITSFIKNSRLWIALSHSDTYQKFRFPEKFRIQQEEFQFYKTLLNGIYFQKDYIFDVGANMGNKSALFSRLSKKVLAFEPSEKLHLFLQKRFMNSNVQVFKNAMGATVSTLEFFRIEGNEAYNSLSEKHIETTVQKRGVSAPGAIHKESVAVETLENFIKKYAVPVFIKIDVEGYELEVIKGLTTVVPLISFEANLPEFKDETVEIIEYLSGISTGSYRFNFTTENAFLHKDFMDQVEAIKFIQATDKSYLEIFARLHN